jgi:hypothetical protein
MSSPSAESPTSRSPQRIRTLNVEVPETVYWHVRKCATESRVSMKEYMARFCQEAHPYLPGADHAATKVT